MVITDWEETVLHDQATPAALLIYMLSRGGEVDMNHRRDREDTVEDVSLNLNTTVNQTLLMPSQVWLIQRAVQRFITEGLSNVLKRWASTYRETFASKTHEYR